VLFAGINPGLRSAATGHHFAGCSNRFWKLLADSGLVPEPLTYEDDHRLPAWGLGITNLVARPTAGVNDLRPGEMVAGWQALEVKVATYRPRILALVGVTVYRVIQPLLPGASGAPVRGLATSGSRAPVLGLRPETIHGAQVFVVPNPSGRNAHFSYTEMLLMFRELKRSVVEST